MKELETLYPNLESDFDIFVNSKLKAANNELLSKKTMYKDAFSKKE